MDERYLIAETLFMNYSLYESLNILNEILNRDIRNIECLLLRGKIYYKLQKWGNALNDFNLILDMETDHQIAKNYKSMILDIISFWNKDNYNP